MKQPGPTGPDLIWHRTTPSSEVAGHRQFAWPTPHAHSKFSFSFSFATLSISHTLTLSLINHAHSLIVSTLLLQQSSSPSSSQGGWIGCVWVSELVTFTDSVKLQVFCCIFSVLSSPNSPLFIIFHRRFSASPSLQQPQDRSSSMTSGNTASRAHSKSPVAKETGAAGGVKLPNGNNNQ